MTKRMTIAVSSVLTLLVTTSGCGGGGGGEGQQHGAASTSKPAGESMAPKEAAGGGTFGTASIHGKVVFEGSVTRGTATLHEGSGRRVLKGEGTWVGFDGQSAFELTKR